MRIIKTAMTNRGKVDSKSCGRGQTDSQKSDLQTSNSGWKTSLFPGLVGRDARPDDWWGKRFKCQYNKKKKETAGKNRDLNFSLH